MKASFGGGPRQENFRTTFTPARNYAFSRVQLKYLHTRVAKILVSIFQKFVPVQVNPIHFHGPEDNHWTTQYSSNLFW